MASTENVDTFVDGATLKTEFSHRIAFDGLRINFVTNSPQFHDWLASYYQTSEDSADEAPEYTVHFEQIGSSQELLIHKPESTLFTKFCLVADAHCYFGNGKFYSEASDDQAHQIELDVANRTVRANLGGAFLRSEESFIYVVVRDILRRLVLPLSGLLMLHGSVVTKGNQTIFFAGNKAMGKSTIALEMMRHGYKIMSDDSPLLTDTKSGAKVQSGKDQLSVTENTLAIFPELQEFLSRQRDVSGKFFLDRTRMGSSRIESNARSISHFVELNRGQTNELVLRQSDKTLATANFVREFMPLFRKELTVPADPEFFKQVNFRMFQTLSAALARAKTFELSYSNEHREHIPKLLKTLCESDSSTPTCHE